jgi:L1 cell adhesion molecule like protein
MIYQTRTSIDNDQIKGKLEESDIQLVKDTLTETDTWLLEERTKDEYENKLKEVNDKLNPVMMKVYSEGQGGAEMPVPPSGVSSDIPQEPTIDEVD